VVGVARGVTKGHSIGHEGGMAVACSARVAAFPEECSMFRRTIAGVAAGAATCACLGLVNGCLTRPVVATNPITNTNFSKTVPTGAIDKVDLLFDIDNSASMGDKEAYLAKAIPDLLTRLVQPNCVDDNMQVTGKSSLSGSCPAGSRAEFPPVHNMHIGIVSSSLGPRLGDACPADDMLNTPSGSISRHNDDQAHLLNRTADPNKLQVYTEGTLADATPPDDFLDWFPPQNVNMSNDGVQFTGPAPVSVASGDGSVLSSDFQQLVVGVHDFGCGIESQLESWYRFLIQPDPYASLTLDKDKHAQWVGVDTTILAQRADFLRPDSLVAVIVLSDENDSEVDVRSFGGTAWNFMVTSTNPTTPFFPPRGTSICLTQPNDPGCTSCAFGNNKSDPQCMTEGGTYKDATDWGADLNLRHVHEKQKYGVSVQFPIQRYVLGLTSPKVPDRSHEYPQGAKSYAGLDEANWSCTNPLYAAALPRPPGGASGSSAWNPAADELCKLTPGPRERKLVFYAHIGGVPHQLLQVDPSDPDSPQKDQLTADDWQLILGKDPETFDYTGIDPHMVESYSQRTKVPVPAKGFKVADESQPEHTDPIAGREWQTDSTSPLHAGLAVDREYACIFQLENARDCSDEAINNDATLKDSCDCASPAGTGSVFTHAEVPAVCNDANPRIQDSAKAYPTIRELDLARLLGQVPGAHEGIISSLCPIHTRDMSADQMSDPLYGYRPAMNTIVSQLTSELTTQCLPTRLDIDQKATPARVPCLVLGTFSGPPGVHGVPAQCKDVKGGAFTDAEPTVLQEFKNNQHAAWAQGGGQGPDPSLNLTCEVIQATPNTPCDVNSENGWCYVENGGTSKKCPQELLFSPTALASGVIMSLQCLEASDNVLGDAGGGD
jgi:hypothetical protein